ncbi:MAG: HlyC/CorC family transporter, partial [Chloroflexi bacterium]
QHRAERYPVYEHDPDYVIGVLHARDALSALAAGKELDLQSLVRPVLTVPSTLPLDRLLEAMREGRTHICVVVDEYGGTAGIVELERLMARLVGQIPDEFDPVDDTLGAVAAHDDAATVVVDGLTLVQDINQSFNLALDEERAHTIGGLVFHAIGRTPRLGDQVELDGVRLTVLELDRLRISSLKLERVRTDVAKPEG